MKDIPQREGDQYSIKSRSGEEQGINQGENKLLGMASLSYVLEGAERFLVALNGCIK